MNSGKLVLGMVAGFTTGTVLGMLFHSAKNKKKKKNNSESEARNASRTSPLLNEINDKFDDFLGTVKSEVSKIKNESVDFAKRHRPGRA